jgi:hypothetical protein
MPCTMRAKGGRVEFEVAAIVGLLALVAWKLTQLVDVARKVHVELVTARWHTHERVRRLERQVEGQGEGALALGGELTDRPE